MSHEEEASPEKIDPIDPEDELATRRRLQEKQKKENRAALLAEGSLVVTPGHPASTPELVAEVKRRAGINTEPPDGEPAEVIPIKKAREKQNPPRTKPPENQ